MKTLPSARKALRLDHDSTFRLLFVLTALLGWVVALGCGGVVMMQNVYLSWQLERGQTISIYLPADAESEPIRQLEADLETLPGVASHQILPPSQLQGLLGHYVANPAALPLPIVVDVQTQPGLARETLLATAQKSFPTAELDDSRPMLQAVAEGVHVMQGAGLGLAGLMGGMMILMVTLTVRAGMKGQRATCDLLQQLGATNRFVAIQVALQVARQGAYGWLAAGGGAMLAVLGGAQIWPTLQPFLSPGVWVGLVVAPAVLPAVAGLTAFITAIRMMSHHGEGA